MLASADCECGYSVNSTTDPSYAVFTDLLETDFLHLQTVTEDTDWVPQTYNVAVGTGYNKSSSPANMVQNPTPNRYTYSGEGRLGGDPGLQLYVRGGTQPGGAIPVAELVSARTDMQFGSFRIAMKYTAVNGTCGSFFFVCLSSLPLFTNSRQEHPCTF